MSTLSAEIADARLVPSALDIVRMPLEHLAAFDRTIVRMAALVARRHVLGIKGLENVLPDRDPFVLVANHSTRLEALFLPAMLMAIRGGRHVHFLADWNFCLIPGVGMLYRAAQVIVVPNKPARPRLLNALRPFLTHPLSPMRQARERLAKGRPVGIFPEGTVNRSRSHLLRGRLGAARLSLEAGVPVVPVGLRYPEAPGSGPIPEGSPVEIAFGAPLAPPRAANAGHGGLASWHLAIMSGIAALSGKLPAPSQGDDDESVQHYA